MKSKIRVALLSCLTLLLVSLLLVWWTQRDVGPRKVTLSLTGRAGQKITAKVTADGTVRQISGVVPTNFVFIARSLSYEVVRDGGAGDFVVHLMIDGAQRTEAGCSADGASKGVRGELIYERGSESVSAGSL